MIILLIIAFTKSNNREVVQSGYSNVLRAYIIIDNENSTRQHSGKLANFEA